jgi:Arc/MetJ-type ribon-helix-helix transcriptional regulator
MRRLSRRRRPKSDMTVLKPRSRMISVRLSEEEYSALRRLCTATGARSVSDLTRDAMRELLSSVESDDRPEGGRDEFGAHIRNLGKKIEQLASEIRTLRANGGQLTSR